MTSIEVQYRIDPWQYRVGFFFTLEGVNDHITPYDINTDIRFFKASERERESHILLYRPHLSASHLGKRCLSNEQQPVQRSCAGYLLIDIRLLVD